APAPPRAVYFAGARVCAAFSVLPLIAIVTLGVGALSYAGNLNITVVADRDAVPDLDAMKERSLPLPGGCWKLPSIRLHQVQGRPQWRQRMTAGRSWAWICIAAGRSWYG